VEVAAVYGDVDASGSVTAADLLLLRRAQLTRRGANAANFLLDLDLNGLVSAADLAQARRRFATAAAPTRFDFA
jgi:hypothetical protein